MASSSKKRRRRRQYYTFFLACLASLVGLGIYIAARYKIPFPHQWFPIDGDLGEKTKLFFLGISVHLQVNFILGIVFLLINTEKMDQVKLRKWRQWITRGLVFIFSLGMGLLHFFKGENKPTMSKVGWGKILLLCLIITVVNCCLLELLIQLMNQYGICNAFNLILFTEFIPFLWFRKHCKLNEKVIWVFVLLLITVFFIWITNLKWEVPVETNTLYSEESKLLPRKRSKLGLKLSFSFMPLYYLSSFISFIFTMVLMKRQGTDWFSWGNLSDNYDNANAKKFALQKERELGQTGFWNTFLGLNENKQIFNRQNLKKWFSERGWIVVGTLLFLVLIRWLVMWIQMRKATWKTKEISKDLQKRGIYINQVPPGFFTRKLLKKIINKLVFFWNFMILIFNVIFDNIFPVDRFFDLSFTSWFSSVNIGVDLTKQIQTKYKYIKSNK